MAFQPSSRSACWSLSSANGSERRFALRGDLAEHVAQHVGQPARRPRADEIRRIRDRDRQRARVRPVARHDAEREGGDVEGRRGIGQERDDGIETAVADQRRRIAIALRVSRLRIAER